MATPVVDMTAGDTEPKRQQNMEALTDFGSVKRIMVESATNDFATITDGAQATSDVTVTGAELGDVAMHTCSLPIPFGFFFRTSRGRTRTLPRRPFESWCSI